MKEFDYLYEKIKNSTFSNAPFKHIYLTDLFSEEHFDAILKSKEIDLKGYSKTEELIDDIKSKGYQAITFPGTTTNEKEYLDWYKTRNNNTHGNANTCEGVGITYRLKSFETDFLSRVHAFFQSEKMKQLLCEKFQLDLNNQKIEGGIQKYLDGYEISPHPDIRKKSLTWMININPMKNSETLCIHTDYLKFIEKYEYIVPFWKHNRQIERCWVPWDWTEKVYSQTLNNSMVIFSPDCDTLHAVKLNYNHLNGQRTQIYGNLWAVKIDMSESCWWDDLIIQPKSNNTLYRKMISAMPVSIRNMAKKLKA